MAEKHVQEIEVHPAVKRAQGFWDEYSKPIIYIGSALIVLIGGYLIYKYFVKLPKEQTANESVYVVQKYFSDFSNSQSDSSKVMLAERCLNGDGPNGGVIKFISKYDGTAAANLCYYYAGACYLNLKQFDKAIKFLKEFHTSSDQIQSHDYGMMGDAYSELKKNGDALSYYEKAGNLNGKDAYTSSEYLFRAAVFAETIGKNKQAVDLYKKIKENYPDTEKGKNIDRYLARMAEFGD